MVSLLPLGCQCYLCGVIVTSVVSMLPLWCQCFLYGVNVNSVVSLLPLLGQSYFCICSVNVTSVVSMLPLWCHCYLQVKSLSLLFLLHSYTSLLLHLLLLRCMHRGSTAPSCGLHAPQIPLSILSTLGRPLLELLHLHLTMDHTHHHWVTTVMSP